MTLSQIIKIVAFLTLVASSLSLLVYQKNDDSVSALSSYFTLIGQIYLLLYMLYTFF